LLFGLRAKRIKDGAEEVGFKSKNIYCFNTALEAGEFLRPFIKKEDVILLKGFTRRSTRESC
jgi:hypothetical protein